MIVDNVNYHMEINSNLAHALSRGFQDGRRVTKPPGFTNIYLFPVSIETDMLSGQRYVDHQTVIHHQNYADLVSRVDDEALEALANNKQIVLEFDTLEFLLVYHLPQRVNRQKRCVEATEWILTRIGREQTKEISGLCIHIPYIGARIAQDSMVELVNRTGIKVERVVIYNG